MEERFDQPEVPSKKNEKRTVLTMIMLGSREHHEKIRNVLTAFHGSIKGSPDEYFHLTDGLGGTPPEGGKHPLVGTYDYTPDIPKEGGEILGTKVVRSKEAIKKAAKAQNKKRAEIKKEVGEVEIASSLGGKFLASGYKDAVRDAIKVINAVADSDKEIRNGNKTLVLNLAGYSRGGDTFLRVANAIAARYPDLKIEINLFELDPVPGQGREKDIKGRYVPDIVKTMKIYSMRDERMIGFNPQDMTHLTFQNPDKTKTGQYIYRGRHRHAKFFLSNPKERTEKRIGQTHHPAYLIWDHMHRFARQSDITLSRDIPYVWHGGKSSQEGGFVDHEFPPDKFGREREMTPREQLQFYNEMKLHAADYQSVAKSAVAKLSHRRKFYDHMENYFLHGMQIPASKPSSPRSGRRSWRLSGSKATNEAKTVRPQFFYQFEDREHLLLFKAVYPAVFDYFFQQNIEGAKKDAVAMEMQEIAKNDATLYASLADVGITPDIGEPKGIHLSANYFYLNKELLAVQENYPAVFDYFLHKNMRYQDQEAVWADIEKIRKDPDLVNLLMKAGVPNLAQMKTLPPPQGDPNILLDLIQYQQLLRLWNGVQSAAHTILKEHEDMGSKKNTAANKAEAVRVLDEMLAILAKPGDAAQKVKEMQDQIELSVRSHPSLLLSVKLNTLLDKPNPDISLNEHIIAALKKYPIENEIPVRQQIYADMMAALESSPVGNDPKAIEAVLTTALQASGILLRNDNALSEGKFDKLLRQQLISLPNYAAKREDPAMQLAVGHFKDKYFSEENGVKRPRDIIAKASSYQDTPKSQAWHSSSARVTQFFRRSPPRSRRQESPPRQEEKGPVQVAPTPGWQGAKPRLDENPKKEEQLPEEKPTHGWTRGKI